MYYPNEKMKVNVFREVRIPSNAEYFARYGFAVSPESFYSGDEAVSQPMNKTQMLAEVDKLNDCKLREEALKNNNDYGK